MFLPVKFTAHWEQIKQRRQVEIARNNHRENKNRIPYNYKVGQKVTLDKPGILRKMTLPRAGPYEVTAVYTNGTIKIRRGAVIERVNIRRVTPYYSDDDN